MICKVLSQLGYTNRLIYTLLTVRLVTACRTRSLRVARMQSFIYMHFLRYRCSTLPPELTSQLGAGQCVGPK